MPAMILHIPHASRIIPFEERHRYLPDEQQLTTELLRMTDAWTEELVAGVTVPATRIVFPVSRLVIDPERFPEDRDEPMAIRGMGAMYTQLSTGELLRHPDPDHRAQLMDRWYWPHHARLTEAVDTALAEHGRALVVDVHSFSSAPLPHEPDQDPIRPKLCIGFDAFHSPFTDDEQPLQIARKAGFTTAIALNRPFAGSIVPAKHWHKNREVRSVMIEVRRDLYLNEGTGEKRADFAKVAARVSRLVEGLYRFFRRNCPTAGDEARRQYFDFVDRVTRRQNEEKRKHRVRMESLGYTFDKFGSMHPPKGN
jgi:N-formylglutamate deformylase